MKTGFLLLSLGVFVLVVLFAAGRATWSSRTAEAVAYVSGQAVVPPDSAFAPAMLESLPPPVARYLRAVLRDGAPLAWRGVVRHEGGFRADTASTASWPFRSVQHFTTRPPGFVWDARMRLAPGVDVFVRDALAGGEGSVAARVAAVYPVSDVRDSTDLVAGALLRWLAETAWFPTALLPGQAVTWTAVDDSTARASAAAGPQEVSLDFHFGTDSLVAYVRADARPRLAGAARLPTPWRGTWSEWAWYGDVRVPTRGEVAWELASGPFTYWRGRVVELSSE